MGAGHHHGHGHDPSTRKGARRLAIVLILVLVYMAAEVIGGLLTNSLALIADAGHMLSDAGALGLSLFAIWIARKPPTPQKTYGYYRTEILAALANGAALVAVSLYIFYEAFRRLSEPSVVEGGLMMVVAVGGLVVNLAGLWILNEGKEESLNVHGAWLHVLADALGSVAAISAGTLILLFGWYWADPIASLTIGVLVIYSSWALLKETVGVLLEGTPGHIDVDSLRDQIRGLSGVTSVHDLHVWTITTGLVAMSGHVTVDAHSFTPAKSSEIRRLVHDRFGIDHTTIQLEVDGVGDCQPVV
ncbi:MAG: cation diffusion facilitator family transporter [Gemmatimonas sp.]|nr:cation diffusion facilitator family transporter [Gemmatimonas sp.]